MKKVVPGLIIVGIAGAMVFTLFHNKAEADRQAAQTNQVIFTSVSTMTVKPQTLESSYTKTGTITASNELSVVAQTTGKVVGVYANVGSRLAKGASILKIDDALLRSKLASARTAYEVALKEWHRADQLHQDKIISDSDLETYQETLQTDKTAYASAQQDYNYSLITSPINGVVTERTVDIGATISSGTTVATVVDNSFYKITVNVGEQEAFKLKVGDAVKIETDVYPGVQLAGTIKTISEKSDSVHTFPVEITIPNDAAHPLKSGIFGKVIFNLGAQNEVLAIPRESLVGSVKAPQVYVVEKGVAKLRNLVVGAEINSKLVVTQGLNLNEQVVVSGQTNLKDNAAVKVINTTK